MEGGEELKSHDLGGPSFTVIQDTQVQLRGGAKDDIVLYTIYSTVYTLNIIYWHEYAVRSLHYYLCT